MVRSFYKGDRWDLVRCDVWNLKEDERGKVIPCFHALELIPSFLK